MKTDAFFYQLFKQLPETLFAAIGRSPAEAGLYQYEAVELKNSFRLDGLFVPSMKDLPYYFLEVQFQRNPIFYPNLFAKVFGYLASNRIRRRWSAVALFASRKLEPKQPSWMLPFITAPNVHRIYLDEIHPEDTAVPGLRIIELATVPEAELRAKVRRLVADSRRQSDCGREKLVVELVEEILIRRFASLGREEVRKMFQLSDLRATKVWKEAKEEGREEGREQGREEGREEGREQGREEGREEGREQGREEGREEGMMLRNQQIALHMESIGRTVEEIAVTLEISKGEVRRLLRVL